MEVDFDILPASWIQFIINIYTLARVVKHVNGFNISKCLQIGSKTLFMNNMVGFNSLLWLNQTIQQVEREF